MTQSIICAPFKMLKSSDLSKDRLCCYWSLNFPVQQKCNHCLLRQAAWGVRLKGSLHLPIVGRILQFSSTFVRFTISVMERLDPWFQICRWLFLSSCLPFFSVWQTIVIALQGVRALRSAVLHSMPLCLEEILGLADQDHWAGKFKTIIGKCKGFTYEWVNGSRVHPFVWKAIGVNAS